MRSRSRKSQWPLLLLVCVTASIVDWILNRARPFGHSEASHIVYVALAGGLGGYASVLFEKRFKERNHDR
mgnify:CR=1 FL=1